MIKLFDLQNRVVVPTEHCYTLKYLKAVMDEYPDKKDHMAIYAYVFYMTCPNPDDNPFANAPELEREDHIIKQLPNFKFSSEDPVIHNAVSFCEQVYETPTLRAYKGIKIMLDNLADYMSTTKIQHGRDGNITAIVNAAAKFNDIRSSFKGALRDLKEEQSSRAKGGQQLSYDQLNK